MWKYYVYELLDPRTETVFYVGKGSGRRGWEHEARVRRGRSSGNRKKDELIKQILDSGRRVITTIISSHKREKDAYAFEAERIASYAALVNQQRGDFDISAPALADRIYSQFKRWVQAILVYQDKGQLDQYPSQEAIPGVIDGFLTIRRRRRTLGLPV